jgi:hypothetical protein
MLGHHFLYLEDTLAGILSLTDPCGFPETRSRNTHTKKERKFFVKE